MMGKQGMEQATRWALLNANYVAKRLSEDYPILYTGKNGRVAHECIVDLRPLKAESGITETDIAKRLMTTASTPRRFLSAVYADDRADRERKQSRTRPLHRRPETNQTGSAESRRRMAERGQSAGQRSAYLASDVNPMNGRIRTPVKKPSFRCHSSANTNSPSVNRVDDVYGDCNLARAAAHRWENW